MANVSDILGIKGSAVYTVPRGASVYEAIDQMVRQNVGALVVTHEGKPCGIVTERDYLRRVALEGRTSRTTTVAEIMSTDLASVGLGTRLDRCMQVMTEQRIRHLPVLSAGHLAGIVSIGDIVKWMIRDQQTQISSLTHYIQGRA